MCTFKDSVRTEQKWYRRKNGKYKQIINRERKRKEIVAAYKKIVSGHKRRDCLEY